MLPAALAVDAMLTNPAGAKQAHLLQGGAGNQYYGPCPRGTSHTYRFRVYAVDVGTLPNLSATSRPTDVITQLGSHSLAQGDLSGMSDASPM
jgi:phosphatidylethanolamine-binding protein (PEBP) family uncharacterized protein